MIENTKNNISGAAIQCRTSPPPSEGSCPRWQEGADTRGTYISRMGNALDGVNGFYLYYEDNISNDVKNIFLIQQLS